MVMDMVMDMAMVMDMDTMDKYQSFFECSLEFSANEIGPYVGTSHYQKFSKSSINYLKWYFVWFLFSPIWWLAHNGASWTEGQNEDYSFRSFQLKMYFLYDEFC